MANSETAPSTETTPVSARNLAAEQTSPNAMFDRILAVGDSVFYRSQQRGESDLTAADKAAILRELFEIRPAVFLERYHRYVDAEFLDLFSTTNGSDNRVGMYTAMIRERERATASVDGRRPYRRSATATETRNRRYAELLRLRAAGSYFSNASMRERAPFLFDTMVGKYLEDSEKLHLRPTTDLRLSDDAEKSQFTSLLEQFDDTQRIADRRNAQAGSVATCSSTDFADRFLNHVEHRTCEADASEEDFEMEFDSSDEEGRQREVDRLSQQRLRRRRKNFGALADEPPLMRRVRRQEAQLFKIESTSDAENQSTESAFSTLQVSRPKPTTFDEAKQVNKNVEEDWSSGDEDERLATGIRKDQLHEEFVSIMEQRFLNGQDAEFFDYVRLDSETWSENNIVLNRIQEQDFEDAYFADE